MSNQPAAPVDLQGIELGLGSASGEVEGVLAALRRLSEQVSIPVVQECLRATCSEIAFLTSTEARSDR